MFENRMQNTNTFMGAGLACLEASPVTLSVSSVAARPRALDDWVDWGLDDASDSEACADRGGSTAISVLQ